ncbi:LCP family protein [Microtetraspora malaysiensis]|uniref:LCP family protein n=1 Tax=Microtetraspora malaysiensis TaxID=161358 RepID=UPI000829CD6B|nr:LCP family protein [Microtetraspora malaysiensis]
MDDLNLLRDLGRELEHEPPASLAHQRRRLLDPSARSRSARAGGSRRTRTWAMVALAAGLTAAVVTVPTVLLSGSGTGRPAGSLTEAGVEAPTGPLNLLLIGSDTREGANAKYGPRMADYPGRSDTLVLVHLAADRKSAEAVSIPRDSMVRIPECRTGDGKKAPAHVGMINSAYADGGLACARKTMETLTGVTVDYAMAIDFSGFKDMIDALGGVEITVPKAVDDPKAKLRMPAGRQVLNGEQALGYARLRYALGDGSDLSRIKRQQVLMRGIIKKAAGLPTDPVRLPAFLKAVQASVKTEPGLNVEEMVALARGLAGMKPSDTRFVTIPWTPYSEDPNRVSWKQPEADQLFKRIASDSR